MRKEDNKSLKLLEMNQLKGNDILYQSQYIFGQSYVKRKLLIVLLYSTTGSACTTFRACSTASIYTIACYGSTVNVG